MSEPANAAPPTVSPEGANRFKQVAPAGAAALAIVVAIIGGTVLTERRDVAAPVAGSEAPAEIAPESAPLPDAGQAEPSLQSAPGPTSEIQPGKTPPGAAVETAPDPGLKPDGGGASGGLAIPGVAQNQVPGAIANAGIEIVVKFKNDAAVKDIIDTFWKDAPAARKKFETFRSRHPLFAGTRLDRVTYSNELVVVADGDVPAARRVAAMREIAAKLGASPEISYAEPNLVAHPGVK